MPSESEIEAVPSKSPCLSGDEASTNRCYFLELTAELRNHIYLYAFAKANPMESIIYVRKEDPRVTDPALSRPCKHIHRETLPVYYGGRALLSLLGHALPVEPTSMKISTSDTSDVEEAVADFYASNSTPNFLVPARLGALEQRFRANGVLIADGRLRSEENDRGWGWKAEMLRGGSKADQA